MKASGEEDAELLALNTVLMLSLSRYYSFGASVDPPLYSFFHSPHGIVSREEGANDGLVSVASSKWGDYKGTLVNVSHLDLINWTNRLRWLVWEMTGNKRKYEAS